MFLLALQAQDVSLSSLFIFRERASSPAYRVMPFSSNFRWQIMLIDPAAHCRTDKQQWLEIAIALAPDQNCCCWMNRRAA